MPFAHGGESRFLLLADFADLGKATGVKTAAWGRINGAGHSALQDDPFPTGGLVYHWHGSHQRLSVRVHRVRKDLVGRPLFDDLAQVHDRHPVADMLDDAQIVSDEEIRQVEFLLQLIQQIDHLGLDGHVQGRDGFVTDDEFGSHGQGTGDADALALAA